MLKKVLGIVVSVLLISSILGTAIAVPAIEDITNRTAQINAATSH